MRLLTANLINFTFNETMIRNLKITPKIFDKYKATKMQKVNIRVWLALLRTLDSKWKDIDYQYDRLTAEEQKIMSETDFEYLVSEIEALKKEEKNGVVYK